MEHLSKLYIIIYGLVIFVINGVCTHPIPKDAILSHNSENSIPFNIDSIIIVSAVFICTITLLVGCLCCHRNVFKVLDSVNNGAAHDGYVNANLGTEFTIFPPRGGSLDERGSLNDVKFEPLPDIRPRGRTSSGSHRPRPACFCTVINRGLPVEDWFEDPSSNFPRNQLQYLQEFGSGWFGQVVEGEAQGINRNAKKNKVVVKILRDDATPTDQIYFLHEVKAFRDLDHPNVMKLLGKCLETDPFLIILEHCAFKDLKTYLIQHRTESESLIQGNILLRMICNIASGLSHMHKKQFVHTDLAVRNCLVTNDLQVKIGDYGNSIEKFKDDYYCATDMAVPIRWCSPESLRCTETTIEPKEVTPESNIWSFGVVMWEVLEFAKLPYTNLNEEEVLQKVVIERFLTLKQPLTACAHKDKIYQVMQLCWLIDPKLRPSMDKVHSLMTHLYTYCNASSKTPTSDFEARWNALQPRTNARLVNVNRQVSLSAAGDAVTNLFESDFTNSTTIVPSSPHASALSFDFASSPASNLSPSLQNLRGSLDDLNAANNNKMAPITLSEQTSLSDSNLSDTTSSPHIKHIKPRSSSVDLPLHISGKLVQREFDQWLASQQSKGDEESNMARQISEAIVTLDAALADENCTSSESNHTSPERDIMTNNDHDEPDEPDSLSFEPITELVKEKSASVQDFLTLTIIDSDNSDTDLTSPSAMNISDEGASTPNMLTVVDNVNCDDEIPINDEEFNTDTLIEPSAFSLTPSNTSTKLNCETDADSTLSNFRSNMDDCDDERMTSTPVRDDDDAGFTNVEMDSSVVWHSAVQTTGSSGFETAVCEAMSTQSDFGEIKMAEMEKCGEFVDGRGEECDRLMSIHCTQCRDEIDRLIEDLVDKESLVDKKKMADFGDGIVDDDREDFKSFSVGEVERDNLVGFVESEDLTRNLVDFGQSENMKISFDDFVQSEDIKVSFDDFDQSEDKASFDNFGQSEDKKISFDHLVQSEDKACFDDFGQSENRKINFDDFGQSEDKTMSFDHLVQSEDRNINFDDFGQSEDIKVSFDDFGQSEDRKINFDDFGQSEDLKTKLDDFGQSEYPKTKLDDFGQSEDFKTKLDDFSQSEDKKISFDDLVQSEDIKVSLDDFGQSEDRKFNFDDFGQSEDLKTKLDDFGQSEYPKTKLDDFGQSEDLKTKLDDFSQSEDKKISFDHLVQSEDKASFDNFGQSEDRKINFDDFGQSEDKKISFDDLVQSEDKASFDNFGQSENRKINFDDFGQSEYPKSKLDDFGQFEDPKTKLDDFGQSDDPKTKLDDFDQSEDPKTKLDDFGQSEDPKTKLDDFGQFEDPKTKLDDFGQSKDPKTKLDDFGQSEEKKLNFYDFIATDEDDMFDFYIAKHERKNSVALDDTEKLAVNVENLNEHRQDLSKIKNEQENLLDLIDTEEIAQNLKDIKVKRQVITGNKNEEKLSDLGVFQNERQHSVSFGDTKDGGQNLDDFDESEDTKQKSDDVEDDVVDFRVTKHDRKHPLDFGDFERIGENLFKFDVENEQQPLVNIDLAKDEEQHWINFDITKNKGEILHDFNVAKEKKQDLINFTTNKDGGENLNDLFDFDEDKSQNLVDFGERIIENNGENDVCEAINSFVMIADTSDKLAPLAHEEDTSSGSTMYEVEDIDDALLDLDEEDERSENDKLEESDALHSSLSESTSKFSQLELKFVSEDNEEEDTFLTVDDIFEAEDYNDASTTPVISNMSNEKNQVHLIPDDNDDEDDDVLVVDTETNEIMMFQNDKLPQMTYTYQAFSELAPKIVWEDEAVNSGGKIMKNAVDSNVDVSWDEVNGPVASTSTSSLDNNTKSIFMWPGSSDEDDDEVGECNKVDLELPRPMAPEPDYSPDWESESDTNSDESSSSSTSGEFDCSKSLDVNGAKSASVDDVVLEVNGENDDEKSGASVRVSTWDKDATPKRSSLKLSPEKKSSQERKSVSFEIAQNPFVYEYPKEKRWDDPPPQRSMWSVPQLQQKQHINYTDWELSADDICDDIVEVEDFDDQANASSTSLFKLNDQLLYRLSDVPLEDFDAEDTNQVAFVDPLMGPITYRELFEHYRSSRFYPPPYDESLQDADSWLTASDDFSYSPSENAEGSSTQILHRSPQMKDDDEFIRLIKSDNTKTEELEKQIVVSETQGAINVQENGNLLSVNNNNNNNNNNSPERNQKNCNQELLI